MLSRSLPEKLSASYLHGFLSVQHAVLLPPGEALRKLFPRFPLRPACCLAPSRRSSPQPICTVSSPSSMLFRPLSVHHACCLGPSQRSSPRAISTASSRPACCLAPSQGNFPQAISTVSHPSSMLSRSLSAQLSASYFHGVLSVQNAFSLPPSETLRKLFSRFPLRPACCLASSRRSSPQPISTVSHPSSMLSRSLPAKLSATIRNLFARFPIRPACCLAPSWRSSPPVVFRPACCLAPSQLSYPQAICTVSSPSSMLSRSLPAKLSATSLHNCVPSSMLSRSLPAKLSASYLHGFLSVQHAVRLPPAKLSASYLHDFLSIQHAVSLPSSEAPRKLFPRFPLRPACCLAPSRRSSPQPICTVSSPSSMLSRSLPATLSPSYLHGFLSVQHAVSLPPSKALRKLFARLHLVQHAFSLRPSEALRKLFSRFPLRPACCLAPSQRTSSQAISTASSRPCCSMLSRSLPAKLSASYFHGFLSVQHAVSLPPGEALRNLFARFLLRLVCFLAPCQRSSPQAICTVSSPSSMLSRSLPASEALRKLFPRLHSVQHAVSLPPSEALPKLFPRFPLRPACCLAPSQRIFPQAISTVSNPSSMLSRSLPAKLSPSYFHGVLSVQHAVSFPPSETLRKLFSRFLLRPACCLAPSRISRRSSPQAICTVSSPSSMLSRSLPAKLSPSYFHGFIPSSMLSRSVPAKLSASYLHGFLSVQHAVWLPPSEALRKLFPRLNSSRPACCLAPSQRSSPQAISTLSSPSSMLSRSSPAKLSTCYFDRFPFSHPIGQARLFGAK